MNRNPATLWKYLAVAGTGTAPTLQPLTFNSFNQISNPTTFTYDNDGDQTADATSSYQWYASGELQQAFAVTYSYDGDGNRVMKSNGKIYWRDPSGHVLDESDLSGNFTDEYVYFGGMRIAHRTVSNNIVYYYAPDALGSSRSIASTASSPCFDADYYPFGGEHDYTATCTTNYKFTGQERDSESGSAVDYFGARYYSNILGRFASPDPLRLQAADPRNPQSWNLYGYVRDNPTNATDPNGLWCVWDDGTGHDPDPDQGGWNQADCKSQGGHWDPSDSIYNILAGSSGNVLYMRFANFGIVTPDGTGTLSELDSALRGGPTMQAAAQDCSTLGQLSAATSASLQLGFSIESGIVSIGITENKDLSSGQWKAEAEAALSNFGLSLERTQTAGSTVAANLDPDDKLKFNTPLSSTDLSEKGMPTQLSVQPIKLGLAFFVGAEMSFNPATFSHVHASCSQQ